MSKEKKTENDKPTDNSLNLFIARQPIFDNRKNVYAYELLYRSDLMNRAYVADDKYATQKVVGNSLLIGLQKLTTGKRAFIHFNRELLLEQLPFIFPNKVLGVEVEFEPKPEARLLQVLKKIKEKGYPLVLHHLKVDEMSAGNPMIPLMDVIKIDFHTTTKEERENIVRNCDNPEVKYLAEKIETQQEYEEAVVLGCQYWQGFFFQKPVLISKPGMPGDKLNYLLILKKIHEPDVNFSEIEEIIKRDVSLTYKLLRFINSANYGFRVTIRSIGHALVLLGNNELKNWLSLIIMSGIGKEKTPELMNTAVIRARFCELTAVEYKLRYQPGILFLIGMFSLAEAFLNLPMAEILEELPLEEPVVDALLGKEGQARFILQMVEAFEKAHWDEFIRLATRLRMDQKKLASLYMDAVEWAKFLEKEYE
ncbi:MAG: HDOD domain-containing protein [bacterium]|nr:HDOD domain-containing protein [bacterium]